MDSKKKQNNLIDISKLFLSMAVVAIHVDYVFHGMSTIWYIITHGAVPVFFVLSGYFFGSDMYQSDCDKKAVITHYVKRIFKLYVIWTVIYLPIAWIYLFHHHPFFVSLLYYMRNVIFVGQNMMSFHLWYVHALLVSILLIAIFHRLRLRAWMIALVGLLLYSFGLLINHSTADWANAYRWLFESTMNGFFNGLSYVSIGYCVAFYRDHLPVSSYVIALIGGLILLYFGIPYYYQLFSYGLVGLLIFVDLNMNTAICMTCRRMSTLVYMLHMLIIVIAQQVLHWHDSFLHMYPIILGVNFIIAYILVQMASNKKLSFLRNFY